MVSNGGTVMNLGLHKRQGIYRKSERLSGFKQQIFVRYLGSMSSPFCV